MEFAALSPADQSEGWLGLCTDFFSSSEVWTKDGKARVIVLWSLSLDVGSEVRTMACMYEFNSLGKLTGLIGSVELWGQWAAEANLYPEKDGTIGPVEAKYYSPRNRDHVARPDEDSQGSFDWVPDVSAFLKIESDLLGVS